MGFNMRSQQARPCPNLLSNRTCPDGNNCQMSHNPRLIRSQQKGAQNTSCSNGKNCFYLFLGTCGWLHSKEQWMEAEGRWMKRASGMSHDLKYLEKLPTMTYGGTIEVTDDRELASFNKVSKGEIAVPGSYHLLQAQKQPPVSSPLLTQAS